MAVRRLAPKEKQPASFTFTEENLAWAKKQIEKYPPGRQASAVIPILWRVQEQHEGWVSEAAIRAVADLLGMPYIRVLEIATFYTMFQLEPVGKKAHVQVCGTTPCMLRGAGDLIDVCKKRIHHDPFHVSADGNFSWEEVECLGACVNAPMVMIWKDTYEDLTPETLNKVLDGFASGNPPKPGPQIDRQFAAPVGGPRVLKGDATSGKAAGAKEPVLADSDAKKAGAPANVREAPKPPGGA
ncbi:NADH-quinone oxidoreductase subunit E [Nitrobacteraceae bacterium AZCC 1564]